MGRKEKSRTPARVYRGRQLRAVRIEHVQERVIGTAGKIIGCKRVARPNNHIDGTNGLSAERHLAYEGGIAVSSDQAEAIQ